MTDHIRNKTKELVFKLNKEGFFGIPMWCRVLGSDDENPNSVVDTNICYATIQPQFPVVLTANCPYITPMTIDKPRFFEDLNTFFNKEFGAGILVKHEQQIDRFQFMRLV